MLKLGHSDDLKPYLNYIANSFGSYVFEDISNKLSYLDNSYGLDRDVYNDDGGYIVLIEDQFDWDIFNKDTQNMLDRNLYEDCFDFNNSFVRVDFLVNNETMIHVYMPKELFKE